MPLAVWRFTAEPRHSEWSPARDVGVQPGERKLPERFEEALADVRRTLSRQRVVWLEGRHLPQDIELSPAASGIRLAAMTGSANTGSRHVVVTRFSVPRLEAATGGLHRDPEWLAGRFELFDRYYVPSVGRLGVPVKLLCSSASAAQVAERTGHLPWITVVIQDEWHGGWTGGADQIVTRLDSDDALHEGWFGALDRALDQGPASVEAYCTERFLRLDPASRRLYERKRREPASLAAFTGGRNPFAHDHKTLGRHYRIHVLPGSYLLQVVHGGNLKWRRPRWRHFPYRVPLDRLTPFGVEA